MNFYPTDADIHLEFDKIKKLIVQNCRSASSSAMAQNIKPVRNTVQLHLLLEQCNEFKNILQYKAPFPDTSFNDISRDIKMLFVQGSVLTPEQFGNIRSVSALVNNIIHFFTEKQKQYPALSKITEKVYITHEIIDAINQIIDMHGEVKSSASKELGLIRIELSSKRRESERKFRVFVNNLRKLGWLRQNEENFYNGRRVLSVLTEHKRDVKGLIHGSSETGKTVFIEPSETIQINNEIAELEQDEKKEIYRLLRQLTNDLRAFKELIQHYQEALTIIDFTRAKALLAYQLNAHLPTIEKQPILRLVNAFHPLLFLQNKQQHKATVPLNIELHAGQRILVISGPNAGGKSVTLKTVGLLQIMLQSGLTIPVAEGSVMSLFNNIFSDIGDSQSIEYELSTYSSRLVKMKYFLEHANRRTLVLIDEFGTGSDPELGGAIAEVVLEELASKKVMGIITTHYSNIKILAQNLHSVCNASMDFDAQTLLPKYQLIIGQPGSSFTFEVAQKTGIPSNILERARKKVNRDKLKLNNLLSSLQKEKDKVNKQLKELKAKEEQANSALIKYEQLTEKLHQKLEINKAQNEEKSRLSELGKKLNILSTDWNNVKNKKDVIQKFVGLMTAEKKKSIVRESESRKEQRRQKILKVKKEQIKVGSTVKLIGTQQSGIVEEIKKEKAKIVFGDIISIVSLENLELCD